MIKYYIFFYFLFILEELEQTFLDKEKAYNGQSFVEGVYIFLWIVVYKLANKSVTCLCGACYLIINHTFSHNQSTHRPYICAFPSWYICTKDLQSLQWISINIRHLSKDRKGHEKSHNTQGVPKIEAYVQLKVLP